MDLATRLSANLTVDLRHIEWAKELGDPHHFKPCACVRLFLEQFLAQLDHAIVYLDTDVAFLDDPVGVYADAVAALGTDGVVAAAAEHGDLLPGESSADAWFNNSGDPAAFDGDGANTGVLAARRRRGALSPRTIQLAARRRRDPVSADDPARGRGVAAIHQRTAPAC